MDTLGRRKGSDKEDCCIGADEPNRMSAASKPIYVSGLLINKVNSDRNEDELYPRWEKQDLRVNFLRCPAVVREEMTQHTFLHGVKS